MIVNLLSSFITEENTCVMSVQPGIMLRAGGNMSLNYI